MFRRPGLRVVNAVRAAPVSSMVVMALFGGVLAATAIAATSQSGGPITAVKVVREANETSTSSTSFVDLPGAATTITVPSGQRALILARFSGQSRCFSSPTNPCVGRVRILIGGVEGAPVAGEFTFWERTPQGVPPQSGNHMIERSRGGFGGLPAGTYEVKVQVMTTLSDVTFLFDNWHLTAERSQVG